MHMLNQLEKEAYQHLIRIIKPIRVDMKSESKKRRIKSYNSNSRHVNLCFYHLHQHRGRERNLEGAGEEKEIRMLQLSIKKIIKYSSTSVHLSRSNYS